MPLATLVATCLWFLVVSSFTAANQANVDCLRTIKSQVEDPNDNLSSWLFEDDTAGFICKFSGVTCWHDDENSVLSIGLSGFGLQGSFPGGIKECSDLTGLDLSRNNFSGPLPFNIIDLLPLVTTLDLSYNSFSGEIPASLANITFLNTLMLQHNQFTGELPPQLALLRRLSKFSVADNLLSGPVPLFDSTLSGPNPFFNSTLEIELDSIANNPTLEIGLDSFANNPDLCGPPLAACVDPYDELIRLGKTGAAVGAAIFAPVGAFLGWFFNLKKKKQGVV